MSSSLRHLRKRTEFLRVARSGRKWVTPGLVLQADPTAPAAAGEDSAPAIGFGLTASKKVGKAVQRNRARRRLRALAREILPRAGRPGCDYVLIARAATVTRPHMDLVGDLEVALRRVEQSGRKASRHAPVEKDRSRR